MPNEFQFKKNPLRFILEGLAQGDPAYRQLQEQKRARREAMEWDKKKQEIGIKAREALLKTKAKIQVEKESNERERAKEEREDATESLNELMSTGMQGEVLGPPPLGGEMPGMTEEEFLPALYEKTGQLDIPAAGAEQMRQLKFPTAEKPLKPPTVTTATELKRLNADGLISDADYIDSLLKKGTQSPLGAPQKSTIGNLEKRIIAADIALEKMDVIEGLYRPEFLTYKGKGRKWILAEANKLGVIDSSQYLTQYSAWKSQQKLMSLYIRKEITGVAGGEKEMKEIMGNLPDPDKDSAIEYESKFERQKQIYVLTMKVLKKFRDENGFNPTKEQAKGLVENVARQYDIEQMGTLPLPRGNSIESIANEFGLDLGQ